MKPEDSMRVAFGDIPKHVVEKEDKRREPEPATNRFGAWQAIKKGTRQHFGNRTVVFTALKNDTLTAIFKDDFPLHDFEFEPALRDQREPYIVQSMDLELEQQLNDPSWRQTYMREYVFATTNFKIKKGEVKDRDSNPAPSPEMSEAERYGELVRLIEHDEVDANGIPFVETIAVFERGTYNCDTEEWTP